LEEEHPNFGSHFLKSKNVGFAYFFNRSGERTFIRGKYQVDIQSAYSYRLGGVVFSVIFAHCPDAVGISG
jgi:hypothetical protein